MLKPLKHQIDLLHLAKTVAQVLFLKASTQENSRKRILVIFNSTPYLSSRIRSGVDYCLAAGAFDQQLTLLLLGESVHLLLPHQNTNIINQKNLNKVIKAFPMYGINNIYIDEKAEKIINNEVDPFTLKVKKSNTAQIQSLIDENDIILNF